MKKTYFVEIVLNNDSKKYPGTRYLKGFVIANNDDDANQIALGHYKPYYTGGDNGQFYIQCCWRVNVPIRSIIEKHWKNAANSIASIREEHNIFHYFKPDKTKSDVLSSWDICNTTWANPVIHWDNIRDGYSVMIHSYMCTPTELIFFKGHTNEVYKKAKKFVRDNTLKEAYFPTF